MNEERQQVYMYTYMWPNFILLLPLFLQAAMELWHAGVLKKFDEERLLIMAESARL